jgi:BlaR1 peptidase M56
MDRELVLAVLIAGLCGPTLLCFGLLPLSTPATPSRERAGARERAAWLRLWLPLAPAVVLLAFLCGWALQEPDTSEARPRMVEILAVAPFGLIWLRAALRAVRALLAPARKPLAATRGLFRPRAWIAPELRARLDEPALQAALAHEAAHARHFDPLRLWLAQIATDVQWPSPAAARRFATWRRALELARDEEACEQGVEGSDLAAALIEAARLAMVPDARGTAAALFAPPARGEGDAPAFQDRVFRLLERGAAGGAPAARSRPAWVAVTLLTTVLAAVTVIGVVYGERIIAAVVGTIG